MMATEKQKKTNKINSKHSTGPKTPAGKAKVAKNATKHGIFTSSLIISTGDGKEDFTEYSELCRALMDDLEPVGKMQELLVEKLAVDHWRLRRLLRYEAGKILEQSHDFKKEAIDHHLNPSFAFLTPEKPAPKELTFYGYSDHIEDAEINAQADLAARLSMKEHELTSIKEAVEYVYQICLDGEFVHPDEDDLQPAKEYIENLSQEERDALREKLYHQELEMFWEMKEVRGWEVKFDRIGRVKCIPDEESLNKIQKYEVMLENSIFKNLAALKTLQTN
jgi:hypothetical protein